MLDNLHLISKVDHEERKSAVKKILRNNCVPYVSQGTYASDREVENIIVRFGNSDKRLVVGAHYDSVEESTGANDNATGVCILIELAKTLMKLPHPVQIDLVFFDWEESAGLGSTLYYDKTGKDSILAMINLDICGVGTKIITAPDTRALSHPFKEAFSADNMKQHDFEILEKLPTGDERIFEENDVANISVCILPEEDVEPMKKLFTSGKDVKKEDFPSIIETMHNGSQDNIEVVELAAMEKVYKFALSLIMNLSK